MMMDKLVDMDLDGLNQTCWFQDNLQLEYEFQAPYDYSVLNTAPFFVSFPPFPLFDANSMRNGMFPKQSWVSSQSSFDH